MVQDVVARAEAMVPVLRERAARCEELRRLPDETLADFLDAGFFRVMQPARYGGLEHDLATLVRVAMTLARGCGSSAWVQCLTAGHNWWAALYPRDAQDEMFADDGDLRFPLVVAPQGRAVPVDGGVEVSGRWTYASGCDVSNWLGVNAVQLGPEREVADFRVCIIRQDEYEIVDDWHVMGLRGTGSKLAVLDAVFVPERRALSLRAMEQHGPPGATVHANPLYRGPAQPIFCLELAAIAVGIAQGALEAYDSRARDKQSAFAPGQNLSDTPQVQRHLAEAGARIAAAEAQVLADAALYGAMIEAIGAGRGLASLARRADFQLHASRAVIECAGAVIELFAGAGTSAMREGEALQRAVRDLLAIRTHFLIDPARASENWGRLAFGLEPLSRLPGL